MKLTTIANKKIMYFNQFNHSYSLEPWLNVVFTVDCRFVIVANYKHHPPYSTCSSNAHVKNGFVPMEGDHPLCIFRDELISFGGGGILRGIHIFASWPPFAVNLELDFLLIVCTI
jgi:hypothetical protein